MGILRRICWMLFRFLPVKKNKIVFLSYYGKPYSDNPKYIAEALLRSGEDLELIWLTEKGTDPLLPEGIRPITYESLSYVYHMSTAGVWVDNARKKYCVKKKRQHYMQTWHGSFGLKKIEKDAEDKLEEGYLRMAKRDAAMADVMLSNSATLTALYREAFWFPEGEIIEKGLPRNDILFCMDTEKIMAIKSQFDLPRDASICLYAPTFRQSHRTDVYKMDFAGVKKALSDRFGGDWLIFLRLHPNVQKELPAFEMDPGVIRDVSRYHDIQELYLVSDVVITDYSSVMFDYMQTGNPVFLYAADIEEYKKERDFFLSPDNLPFPLAKNDAELQSAIREYDPVAERKKTETFIRLHGFCDEGEASGDAAERILRWVRG